MHRRKFLYAVGLTLPLAGCSGGDEEDTEATTEELTPEPTPTQEAATTELEIENISDNWNGRVLESVEVKIRNTGDMEAQIQGSLLESNEELVSAPVTRIQPGETETVEFRAGNIYEIDSGGTTEFKVRFSSNHDQVSDHFSSSLNPGDTTLRNISATWANGNLQSVIVEAVNSGELEDVVPLRVEVNGEKIATQEVPVQSGEQETINFGQFADQSLVKANSGGTYTVTVIDTDTGQTVSDEVTFEGIDVEVTDLTVNSYENFDSDTSDIIGFNFKLRNNGDITLRYDAVRVEVADESRRDSTLVIGKLAPGGSTTEVLSFDSNMVVDSGSHNLRIELLRGSEVVASGSSDLSI